jgi:hypothetical protein
LELYGGAIMPDVPKFRTIFIESRGCGLDILLLLFLYLPV